MDRVSDSVRHTLAELGGRRGGVGLGLSLLLQLSWYLVICGCDCDCDCGRRNVKQFQRDYCRHGHFHYRTSWTNREWLILSTAKIWQQLAKRFGHSEPATTQWNSSGRGNTGFCSSWIFWFDVSQTDGIFSVSANSFKPPLDSSHTITLVLHLPIVIRHPWTLHIESHSS